MAEFAEMRTPNGWYAHLAEDELKQAISRATVEMTADKRHGKAAKTAKAAREAGVEERREGPRQQPRPLR